MGTAKKSNPERREGRGRVVIEGVAPEIDGGRFAIKRIIGESVLVEADIYTDGHDAISAVLLYRPEREPDWTEVPMQFIGNDRWRAEITVTELGRYRYCLQAWVDRFGSWRSDLKKRVDAQQEVETDLLIGAGLIEEATKRASAKDAKRLKASAVTLRVKGEQARRIHTALSEDLVRMMEHYPDKRFATTYTKELPVIVDRERARFSAWYEMFPRSSSSKQGHHGTFKDCEARLPYIAEMGFDILYLPPIHPVGRAFRKGRNNTPAVKPDDVGSPWAIGAREGGHKAIHPQLGTLKDFHRLLAKAEKHGIEIALDIAFQCSPDHPYVKQHPGWFRRRPDGTIQHAENPPKKYQDIYPFDFDAEDWTSLWEELKGVVLYWIAQGVRIFRVDNPHTKPFAFWEWLIGEVKGEFPDVIFLSEAFTRPKVMYKLAKLGFTQSYTYFAWRNTKSELTQYFTELPRTEVSEYFRTSLWPNTPDILTEYLQFGGRPAFMTRLVLAATLGANYGIYGPAFELCESKPREPRSEEYLDSEKYEIKHWDTDNPNSLKDLIARVNRIRRENPALHSDLNLRFYPTDNDELICYGKHTADFSQIILVVVNLDPRHAHSGWVDLPLQEWGYSEQKPYQVHDLLDDARYLWHGPRNYVELNPHEIPAHIFRVRRLVRSERDFDYYL